MGGCVCVRVYSTDSSVSTTDKTHSWVLGVLIL